MGINRVSKRGQQRIEVRRRWPDGTTFRRYYPNMSVARNIYHQIEVAVADGTWQQLKDELCVHREQNPKELTLGQFAELYLETYCRVRNRRPDFKVQALSSIRRILGEIGLQEFSRSDVDKFIAVRAGEVAPATINRGLSVLKNMLNFAAERGYIESNPLTGFSMLPEEQRALSIMKLSEERLLIESVAAHNPVIAAYVAVLGETGLRKSEGLRMAWEHIDWERRMLIVPRSKTGEPRYVPLSDYAMEWLRSLPRYEASPWVFTQSNGQPLKNPRGSFSLGCAEAGLNQIRGFHDLRHFRATQWLTHGVDINTVKYYLGHKRVETTMRYLHFVPGHGEQTVRAAQLREERELKKARLAKEVA